MAIQDNTLYKEDVNKVAALDYQWDMLKNSSILITGATGQIGSFLVDVLMQKNTVDNLCCTIFAVCRNVERAKERFEEYSGNEYLKIIKHDVNDAYDVNEFGHIDYLIHLASNTHPLSYSTDPIGTVLANVTGTYNILDFASNMGAKRVAFASSNEIYGENRGDSELFDEKYCGYIDCNTLRAGYPEGKRCGEALCQAFIKQKELDVVIPRLTRTYGPTILSSDTKAISQFLKKAVNEEDIVLKSEGKQYYSYTYVADAVSGLLLVTISGKKGEAYNIAHESSDITLKDLSGKIASTVGKKVVFELPDEVEKAGYSTATKARLNGTKIKELGWKPLYDISSGVERTIKILKDIQ